MTRARTRRWSALAVGAIFGIAAPLAAQEAATQAPVVLAPEEATEPTPLARPADLASANLSDAATYRETDLDDLVAPVALYPDALLTQVLVAATYPLDVVKAARFVSESADLDDKARATAAEAEPWDPSVQVLAGGFPSVVVMMADDLDWTEALGDAVIVQTDDVLDAIQRMRAQAAAVGNLESNEAQVVEIDQGAVSIAPANPEIVYVPTYDPETAYFAASTTAPIIVDDGASDGDLIMAGVIGFGAALIVDEIFDDDDDWNGYWGPNYGHIDWNEGDLYPQGGIDIDGDVNIDRGDINIDRDRIDGEGGRIGDRDPDTIRENRGWEPSADRRAEAVANIDRRQGGERDRAAPGGGAIAARSEDGGAARARLAEASAKRPANEFPGMESVLQPRAENARQVSGARERGAASSNRQIAPSVSKGATRPKSVTRPSATKQPVRKAQPNTSALKKQSSGNRAKAASSRGGRSSGRSGGGRRR